MPHVAKTYSIPLESKKILEHGILGNPLHVDLPSGSRELSRYVEFVGPDNPSIPINWRFAESIASLKGFEAVLINQYLGKRYGTGPYHVTINTDHAQLFIMSSMLGEVNPPASDVDKIAPATIRELNAKYAKYFPSCDVHDMASSFYRRATQNIWKTKDGQFFHVHPSLNPDPTLQALGLPLDRSDVQDVESAFIPFRERIAQSTARELDELLGEKARQAATICHKPKEFAKTPHGQANASTGLYRIHDIPHPGQGPCWAIDTRYADPKRPLLGIKIVDFTRVIAGPSLSRTLAELGASVMRVTAPHLSDFSGLHADLNWGKWNCHLDLREEKARQQLQALIMDADMVVDGYRPHVFEKYGFGSQNVLEMCKARVQGIIYVRENCFGWEGPLAHRSGWQPISDASSGVSYGFGQAMGNEEPVTPVFPNSDYCTGVAGACAAIDALLRRGERGGSYLVDVALNYYNTWLINSVGEYPPDVWEDVWTRNGRKVFRHFHSMNFTLPSYLDMLVANSKLFRPEYFEVRYTGALDIKLRAVKPVLMFQGNGVRLGYNVGTRGNGIDQPRWPEDLSTEVIK